MELTSFDKSLLNLLQGSLPVCSRPFAALAEQLGTTLRPTLLFGIVVTRNIVELVGVFLKGRKT